MCGTVWSGFGDLSICCVWDCLELVRGSEFVGLFEMSWGVSVCCVWVCLE